MLIMISMLTVSCQSIMLNLFTKPKIFDSLEWFFSIPIVYYSVLLICSLIVAVSTEKRFKKLPVIILITLLLNLFSIHVSFPLFITAVYMLNKLIIGLGAMLFIVGLVYILQPLILWLLIWVYFDVIIPILYAPEK